MPGYHFPVWVFRQEWTYDGTDNSRITGCSYHLSLEQADEFTNEHKNKLPGLPFGKPYEHRVFGKLYQLIASSKNGYFKPNDL